MKVFCKPEGRLTERFFSLTIMRTIIIVLYFFIMQNLRFRTDACMHFNCNNELEVSQTWFPRHCCFCLAFQQISKGALNYCTEKSLITLYLPFTKKNKNKEKKDKNKNISVSLHWLVETDDEMTWLVLSSSFKLCIEGLLFFSFLLTSSWDGRLFTCHWLNVYLKNFHVFSFFLKFWIKKMNESWSLVSSVTYWISTMWNYVYMTGLCFMEDVFYLCAVHVLWGCVCRAAQLAKQSVDDGLELWYQSLWACQASWGWHVDQRSLSLPMVQWIVVYKITQVPAENYEKNMNEFTNEGGK